MDGLYSMAVGIQLIKEGNGYGGSIALQIAVMHPELAKNTLVCAALGKNMAAGGVRLCRMSLKDKAIIVTLLKKQKDVSPLAHRMLMAWRPCKHRERFAYAGEFVRAVVLSMDRRRKNGWTSLPEDCVHIVIMLALS